MDRYRTCLRRNSLFFERHRTNVYPRAVTRSRDLLRRILKEHAPDDARQMLAERVVEHLEASGFEVDEAGEVLRRRVRRYTGRLANRWPSALAATLHSRFPAWFQTAARNCYLDGHPV
jgi:hypothetical protein